MSSARRRRRPWWLRLLLLLVLAGLVRLTWDLAAHWDELAAGGRARFALLLGLRLLALAAGGGALLWALRRPAAGWPSGAGRLTLAAGLRAAACILLAAIAVASLVLLLAGLDGDDRFAARAAYRSTLLLATSVWLVKLTRGPAGPGRAPGVAPVLAVNLFLALLALEGVALFFARLYPTRLLWNEESVRSTIEANRLEPGAPYLGFAANSGGYYDEEFVRGGPDDLVVALLADSFGVGIVPHKHNFATVAERFLARRAPVAGRVAVNNFGVAAIGLPEYAWLLENEVPATEPSRVVLALFVGNDISGLESRRRHGFYSLQQLQLFELGRRLAALGQAARRSRGGSAGVRRRAPPPPGQGTFDEATFLEIEEAAFELCNTRSRQVEGLYRSAFDWLARLHRLAGDRLLVALLPDEYQVNDALFAALMARVALPAAYDRHYPQRRLAAFCRRQGIEVLDLLPPLRRAHRERRVYRLRDTHWNERGNRVAGEAIADRLLAPEPVRVPGQPVDVEDVGAGARAGDSLAVRQLYRGRELGRITWRFE